MSRAVVARPNRPRTNNRREPAVVGRPELRTRRRPGRGCYGTCPVAELPAKSGRVLGESIGVL